MKQSDEIQLIEDAIWAYLSTERNDYECYVGERDFHKNYDVPYGQEGHNFTTLDGLFSLRLMAEAVHKALKEG